jgi:hypothetical protein
MGRRRFSGNSSLCRLTSLLSTVSRPLRSPFRRWRVSPWCWALCFAVAFCICVYDNLAMEVEAYRCGTDDRSADSGKDILSSHADLLMLCSHYHPHCQRLRGGRRRLVRISLSFRSNTLRMDWEDGSAEARLGVLEHVVLIIRNLTSSLCYISFPRRYLILTPVLLLAHSLSLCVSLSCFTCTFTFTF